MDPTTAAQLGIRFHHLGLLTDAPDAAASALGLLGYRIAEPVFDPLQDVHLRMAEGPVEGATIELITPASREGSLAKLVTRRGDYMYHSCFVARDVAATLAALAGLGLRVVTVSPAKPAVLFGGKRVSFHSVEGLGLVEFIEDGE
jgi:Glyoxalase/Bleomycin resistance protein/Dioxygenase superfamily